jgi:hypothetical protein
LDFLLLAGAAGQPVQLRLQNAARAITRTGSCPCTPNAA